MHKKVPQKSSVRWTKEGTWVSGGAGLAGLPKAMFRIGTAALWLGHCTWEWARARAHLDSTVACRPHVCVHTHSSIYIDSQAWWALTAEGALRVDAAAVHANARSLTLIDVWWRGGGGCNVFIASSQAHKHLTVAEISQCECCWCDDIY